MKSNISAFVKKGNKSFYLSDLLERIVGLFLYAFALVFIVEITSPLGVNGVTFFSDFSLPYTCSLIAFATVLSVVILILYKMKSKCGVFLIDGIMNLYFSITLLLASLVDFDGYSLSFQNIAFVIIKVIVYVFCLSGYLILLFRKIIPTASKQNSSSNYKYAFLAPSLLVLVTNIMGRSNYVDVGTLFSTMMFCISVALIMYSTDMFVKAYFTNKYKSLI